MVINLWGVKAGWRAKGALKCTLRGCCIVTRRIAFARVQRMKWPGAGNPKCGPVYDNRRKSSRFSPRYKRGESLVPALMTSFRFHFNSSLLSLLLLPLLKGLIQRWNLFEDDCLVPALRWIVATRVVLAERLV